MQKIQSIKYSKHGTALTCASAHAAGMSHFWCQPDFRDSDDRSKVDTLLTPSIDATYIARSPGNIVFQVIMLGQHSLNLVDSFEGREAVEGNRLVGYYKMFTVTEIGRPALEKLASSLQSF